MIVYLSRMIVLILALMIVGAIPGFGQSDEIDALKRRVVELDKAGKYAEAIPLAERRWWRPSFCCPVG
jgi:hypothetical protein